MNAIASRHTWRQLAGPSGDGLNPYLNADGVFIGDSVPLLEKTADGLFAVRAPEVLEVLLRIGYGGPVEMSGLRRSLDHVAKCLITGFAPLASLAHARAMLSLARLTGPGMDTLSRLSRRALRAILRSGDQVITLETM